MGDDRRELNLAQDRQYQATAKCTTCGFDLFSGPPLDGAEVMVSRQLIDLATPSLTSIHRHAHKCDGARVVVVVLELQASGPLVRPGRRHLRIVA
jgi:hypothetical protein